MKLLRLIQCLRDRWKTVVRWYLVGLVGLVVLDAIPAIVDKEHHVHSWIEKLPGFWALFGLLGCVLLIILSKAFGHMGIMKREDYYDD
jgi:hypothetical protein